MDLKTLGEAANLIKDFPVGTSIAVTENGVQFASPLDSEQAKELAENPDLYRRYTPRNFAAVQDHSPFAERNHWPASHVRVHQPYYDTEHFPAGTRINELRFFQRQLSSTTTYGSKLKTTLETNSCQPGQLPAPLFFDILGLCVSLSDDTDWDSLSRLGYLELLLSGNRIFLSVPLSYVPVINRGHADKPNVFAKLAAMNPGDRRALLTGTQGRPFESVNWLPDEGEVFAVTSGEKILRLQSQENFQVRLVWPNAVKLVTPFDLTVYLDGYMYLPW